jgi:hypothetical protein
VSGALQLNTSGLHNTPAHDLGHGSVVEVAEPLVIAVFGVFGRNEQIPQPCVARPGFQFVHDGQGGKAVVGRFELPLVFMLIRVDVFVHEGPKLRLVGYRCVAELVHGISSC